MTERIRATLLRLLLLAQVAETVVGLAVTTGGRAPASWYLPYAAYLLAALALVVWPRRLLVALFEALRVPGFVIAISREVWPISGLVLTSLAFVVLVLPDMEPYRQPATEPAAAEPATEP